jgi:hypothetical protein
VVSAERAARLPAAVLRHQHRADADGNLWVLTIPTKPQPAGSVYDVINGKGEVTERVLIPEGRTILGFGPGGVVYLAKRGYGTNLHDASSAPDALTQPLLRRLRGRAPSASRVRHSFSPGGSSW